jgi:hypothetical protein
LRGVKFFFRYSGVGTGNLYERNTNIYEYNEL